VSVAALEVAEPAATGPALEVQLEGRLSLFSVQLAYARDEPLEHVARGGFDLDGLVDVDHHVVQ
jgi:hypothetical protein